MGLNPKQKQAVEYLEGPLLVLAGPGTGKTQLLSEKVAYILKNVDVKPENILCMTFTESGVANMRERLKTIIGAAGGKVHVSTYHSFGSEILAEYQHYADDYPRRLDEAIDELGQFKIIKQIQSELPGDDILQKDNVRDIASVISEAKAAGLSAKDLQTIAEQNIADSEVLSEQISPLLSKIVPRNYQKSHDDAYEPIFELLRDYTEAPLIVKNIERTIGVLARDLKEAMAEAEGAESIKPLSDWKDKYFEKDERGGYRLKDRNRNRKLKSIATVMQKYGDFLTKNGLYDFDDMIQEAIRVLRKDAGFRATLTERYQFIMLDEFQDTNPSQFAIIKLLTDYEKPLVMAVGDDDQAIYEFQGARSTNLMDFQNYYAANVVALTENYRSTQEILDFAREIINQAGDRFADKCLTAHRDDPAESQIKRYEFLSSELEYSFVAEEIAKLVAEGVPQSEIAVISCKHRFFMPLLPFLKAHPELKIAYEKRDNLFENEQIHQILTICEYVYELANEKRVDTNVLEILSYPFWGLKMTEVLKVTGEAKRKKTAIFDEIVDTGSEAVREVGEFIAKLVAKSFTAPLETMLNYIIGAEELDGYRSPMAAYYEQSSEVEAFTLYENLAVLRARVKKHCGEKKLRLNDLVEMIREYEEAGMALAVSSPYRDADEAVQILTAHKAKGLEFRYVFILGADHTAWGKGKGNNNTLALPVNLTQIRHTGVTDGEKLRVLYVALTRAKEMLYITNSRMNFDEKSLGRLEYLAEYEKDGKVISPFLPLREVQEMTEAGAKASVEDLKRWLAPYLQPEPEVRALYTERVQNYRMSASSLTSFIDIAYSGPQEFFRSYVLQVPFGESTESQIFGNLVHAVFEAVTKQGLDDVAALEVFETELEKLDLPEEVVRRLKDRGAKELPMNLQKFGAILRDGKAEVDFSGDKLEIAGVPVTGKIDHIVVDEKQKTIEIYDFKTGAYKNKAWQGHQTLYKYMLQLEFYKLLLGASVKYRDYKVERAHILFVTPDDDGEVHEKTYEFNPEDEKELVALMQAVYNLVTTLRFIEDAEIFVPADAGAGIKEIKAFVELVLAKNQKV